MSNQNRRLHFSFSSTMSALLNMHNSKYAYMKDKMVQLPFLILCLGLQTQCMYEWKVGTYEKEKEEKNKRDKWSFSWDDFMLSIYYFSSQYGGWFTENRSDGITKNIFEY